MGTFFQLKGKKAGTAETAPTSSPGRSPLALCWLRRKGSLRKQAFQLSSDFIESKNTACSLFNTFWQRGKSIFQHFTWDSDEELLSAREPGGWEMA